MNSLSGTDKNSLREYFLNKRNQYSEEDVKERGPFQISSVFLCYSKEKFQASGSKAPNYNTQITNPPPADQIPISNVQNVCDFEF